MKRSKPLNKKRKIKLSDIPDYNKVDILFHAKEVMNAIRTKLEGDKLIAEYYGWKDLGVNDNSDLREFHNQLIDFMNEVHENW